MPSKQVNEFNLSGKVLFVGMPVFFTDNMSKRILVIEGWVKGKYKQEIPFDFVNDNMGLLDHIRIGDWVNVDFTLRGRKNIGRDGKAKWFGNNEGIAVMKED